MSIEELKMLRSVLDRPQHHGGLEGPLENATSTPLRGGNMAYPRIRLMDKHTKLTQIPVYTLPPSKPTPGVPSVARDKVVIRKPEKWLPHHVYQRQACQSDRFIPQRRHRNFEASNYFLTKVPPRAETQNQVDIFGQMLNLETTWRKKLMKNAMERSNLLPSTSHQQVLNIGKTLGGNRESYRGVERTITDSSIDGVWKIRARAKPLIGMSDIITDLPTMRHNWRRGLFDWGAKNVIAAMVGTTIVISTFDGKSRRSLASSARVISEIGTKTRAIKWNNAGTMFAICTEFAEIMIYNLVTRKQFWVRDCLCTVEKPGIECEVLCVAWSHTDTEIVIGCSEGRLTSYRVSAGTVIDSIFAHTDMILAVAFSPNDRYLVSTGIDKAVRVHTWPGLMPHLAISYYEPVQAFAWHPWEVDKLCVGGGFEDGSLSLWDIHRQKSLGYRKVPFLGVVKNMAWNKLSGELVVQWNYQHEDSVRAVVPVLASLDRVVDLVSMAPRIMDIVWSPCGTKLAMRMKDTVKVWNFFGNETSSWYDEQEERLSKRRRIASAGWATNFEKYSIR